MKEKFNHLNDLSDSDEPESNILLDSIAENSNGNI